MGFTKNIESEQNNLYISIKLKLYYWLCLLFNPERKKPRKKKNKLSYIIDKIIIRHSLKTYIKNNEGYDFIKKFLDEILFDDKVREENKHLHREMWLYYRHLKTK